MNPTKVDDFVGLHGPINVLKRILKNYKKCGSESRSMCLVGIVGPTGSGKSSLSRMILKENGFKITSLDHTYSNEMMKIIRTKIHRLDVQDMMSGDKSMHAIIIEDIDSFSSASITDLKNLIAKNKKEILMLITCSSRYENSLLPLKKFFEETIHLKYPTIQQAFTYFSNRNSDDAILEFIRENGTCMGYILSHVDLGIFVNKNENIIDMNQYDLVNYIVKSKKSGCMIDNLLSYDLNMISLIVLENITSLFPHLSVNQLKGIYEIFVDHDILNHYFLKKRDEHINYMSIIYIISKIIELSKEHKVDISKKLQFTQVITKMSAKSMSHRKISDMVFEERLPLDMDKIYEFANSHPKYLHIFNKMMKKKC